MITTATPGQARRSIRPLMGLNQRLQNLWYLRPVRTQILIAFLVITLIASIIAGLVKLLDASNRASTEMRAAVGLAESFAQETTRALQSAEDVRNLPETLASRLRPLRHVRIDVVGAGGDVIQVETSASRDNDSSDSRTEDVPQWFIDMVQPPPELRKVLVMIDRQPRAAILIQGDPADEIAEVWNDFRTMIVLWLVTNLIMLGALYVVLGRILDPLVGLAAAMKRLEHGHSAVRVDPPRVRELRLIADRFNQLASALDMASAENSRLCRDLITVQEEERRQIASELHDEVGPCLFGIMVNAASIEQYADLLPREKADEISSRIGEVRKICDRLKLINRQLLKRLRPIVLGRITIKELITKLTGEFEDRHPEVRLLTITNDLQPTYGEQIDLTIYRCVQEGITNALRHADPSNIVVELLEKSTTGPDGEPASSQLRLIIRDDGKGISDTVSLGFGLGTMRERVKTLNGNFSLGRNWPSGTAINITIPTGAPGHSEKRSGELFGNQA